MGAETARSGTQRVSNRSILVLCLVFFCAMIGMAYAAVPLYTLFCRVTGYNGTTQRVEQYSDVILDKTINVTFDANTSNGLNWDFQPVDRKVTPKIGETVQVTFKATNRSPVATTGTEVFNVTPMEAGAYFNKVECFCFTEQVLKPGERVQMPVTFYVDPAMVTDREGKYVHEITLSYTFFEQPLPQDQAALAPAPAAPVN